MSRPLRIEYSGAWYHVMNRGIAHQPIFYNPTHRAIFLDLLREISNKFYIEIHAYCLMDNHYHLLVHTPIPNLGRVMRHLNGVYTRRFNICQKRDGPIFKGRYHAILIEQEQYLIEVSRYIHLNPSDANVCNNPCEYLWSSYRYFLDQYRNSRPAWLKIEKILSYFDNAIEYKDFVAQRSSDELIDFYCSNSKIKKILGREEFVEAMLEETTINQRFHSKPDINRFTKIYSIEDVVAVIEQYFNVSYSSLKISARGKQNIPRLFAMAIARQYAQLTHQEISHFFTGISAKSVGTLLDRFVHLLKDVKMKDDLEKIVSILEKNMLNRDI